MVLFAALIASLFKWNLKEEGSMQPFPVFSKGDLGFHQSCKIGLRFCGVEVRGAAPSPWGLCEGWPGHPPAGWCVSLAARVPDGPHGEVVTGQDGGEGVPAVHG